MSNMEEVIEEVLLDEKAPLYLAQTIAQALTASGLGGFEEWRPIETAPKDGTWVRLYRPKTDFGVWDRAITGRWSEVDAAWVWPCETFDEYDGLDRADGLIENGGFWEDGENFTHWMPLPDPPAMTTSDNEARADG